MYPAGEAGPDDGKVPDKAEDHDEDVEDGEQHVPVVWHPASHITIILFS